MKRVVFIETRAGVPFLIGFLKENKDVFCLSSNERLAMDLQKKGVACQWLGEYLAGDDYAQSENKAIALARSWSEKTAAADFLCYRGVHLGRVVELAMGTYLLELFKIFYAAQNFLSRHSIDEAVVIRRPAARFLSSFYVEEEETFVVRALEFFGVRVRSLFFSPKKSPRGIADQIAASAKDFMRGWGALWVKNFKPVKEGSQRILFCAALQHIRGIIACAAEKKSGLFYLDETFQYSKQSFLKHLAMRYLVMTNWLVPQREERDLFLQMFKKKWPAFLESFQRSEVWRFEGKVLSDATADRLDFFSERKVLELTKWIDAFYEMLNRNRITKLVLDEDSVDFRKCLASVARCLGIRSLVVLHATTPSFCNGFDLAPLTADAIAVGGEAMKADCVKHGILPEQIFVTGVPRYDEIKTPPPARLKPLTALFACTTISDRLESHGAWGDVERGYRDFLEIMARHPEISVIFKLYPMDTHGGRIKEIAESCGVPGARVVSDIPFPQLAAAAELVISFPSSAVTEAVLLGKPTLVLDTFRRVVDLEIFSSGPCDVMWIREKEKLQKTLEAFFSGDARLADQLEKASRHLAREWAGACDGKASQRVFEALCG